MKKAICRLVLFFSVLFCIYISYDVEAKTIYTGGLVKKNSKLYKVSKEYGWGYVYKLKIKGNKIIIYGNMKKKTSGSDEGRLLGEGKSVFKITKKTKYCEYAGMDENGKEVVVNLSKKKFLKEYKRIRYQGVGMGIVVKKGKVVKISFNS